MAQSSGQRDEPIFRNPGYLVDEELRLVLREFTANQTPGNLGPAYQFDMIVTGQGKVGDISLRVTTDERILKFAGHIDYGVELQYRGRRYAARACTLLLPLARSHAIGTLWLTCSPDDAASRRTCEIVGATLAEIIGLPVDSDLYRQGQRQICRYRLDL